jgi:hypothetical protein
MLVAFSVVCFPLVIRADEVVPPLPDAAALGGWSRNGEPRKYAPEKLWEYVDGAAEEYLEYGCRELWVAYYKQATPAIDVTVELYRMGDPTLAFGIFARQRGDRVAPVPVGAQGQGETGSLSFHDGVWYVRLQAMPPGEAAAAAVRELALRIDERITPHSALPPELALFPREDLVERSFGFQPTGVLGLKDVGRAFTARYRQGESEATIYLITEATVDAARETFTRVRDGLAAQSVDPPRRVAVLGALGYHFPTRYHGLVFAVHRGRSVVVVRGHKDRVWAESRALKLLENIEPGKPPAESSSK